MAPFDSIARPSASYGTFPHFPPTHSTPSGAKPSMANVTAVRGELGLATWAPRNTREPLSELEADYATYLDSLRAAGDVILHERAFGSLDLAPAVVAARETLGGSRAPTAPPLNYIDGGPTAPGGFAGIHVLAARPAGPVRAIERDGCVVGRIVTTENAEILALSDVASTIVERGALSPAEETAAVLASAEQILAAEGWTFLEVIRTWFYLRDILSWYDDFNRVRNEAFRRFGLLGTGKAVAIPASTGIEGRNARGGHCTLDLIAARPRPGKAMSRKQLENRRQNEATEYGSAFARGTSLDLGSLRYVFVSGTAAIDDQGRSVHDGDFTAQTSHTMDAIAALMEGTGAGLADFCQATGFVKRTADVPTWNRLAHQYGLASVPTLGVRADVCRPELLFELDGTAVVPVPGARRS